MIKKIKNMIKTIKKLSKDPRKKALLQLGAWMIFFFLSYIVIILLHHPIPKYGSSSNSNKVDSFENYSTMKSFEYIYTFSYQGKVEEMKGTYFDNNYYFTYLDSEYYSSLENIYKVDSTEKVLMQSNDFIVTLSLKELNKETINSMIKDSNVIEVKEYKDGKKITSYEYKKEEKIISLTVTESNSIINEILVDYKDYYVLYPNLQVKLEYNEINNLTSYSKNYSDYQVVEGE